MPIKSSKRRLSDVLKVALYCSILLLTEVAIIGLVAYILTLKVDYCWIMVDGKLYNYILAEWLAQMVLFLIFRFAWYYYVIDYQIHFKTYPQIILNEIVIAFISNLFFGLFSSNGIFNYNLPNCLNASAEFIIIAASIIITPLILKFSGLTKALLYRHPIKFAE